MERFKHTHLHITAVLAILGLLCKMIYGLDQSNLLEFLELWREGKSASFLSHISLEHLGMFLLSASGIIMTLWVWLVLSVKWLPIIEMEETYDEDEEEWEEEWEEEQE